MSKYIKRLLNIDTNYSSFLWGARRTAKSCWIKHNFNADEILPIDLKSVMVSGMLPLHFLSKRPAELIRSYVADYLKEEIAQEAEFKKYPSEVDDIKIIPWKVFLEMVGLVNLVFSLIWLAFFIEPETFIRQRC